MKLDANLCNNLKLIRTRLGMSQQHLANLVGVTRQTVGGVESGLYAPSITITLRLAKVLGCKIEDLFWLEQDLCTVEAVLTKPVPIGQRSPVSLAQVGGQWFAYPLSGKDAFGMEIIPADGEILAVIRQSAEEVSTWKQLSQELDEVDKHSFSEQYLEDKVQNQNNSNKALVRLLDDIDKLYNTIVIAGCTPVLSLFAKVTERWHPQMRVHYHFAHSMAALASLCRGEVHIAGMHLYDPLTREHNIPFVREALIGKSAVVITVGVWEEGLLVPPGNPMGIKTVTDVVELGATIITHGVGTCSRMLLEQKLQEEQIPLQAVKQLQRIAQNHQDIALSVVSGSADAGISTASIAVAFGLEFIPLHQSRYDLVILKEYLEEKPVQQFLSILENRTFKWQLEAQGGYDITNIGQVVATI
ncbi:substrate-binding domain-containing protein [Calothrix sp. UHCC 0171]|uniref:substrate-binding domain-containing protein n=1 Tax=Calothrix sp. UHCC 0171 TaxID=3110245 RepID=UPI002B1F45A6|nr:substrate-binding domain-containing protein [Calothrix sp. UHCC 0171]MEA5574527.1 substrate-binding domain-containing protein [Calothrix sp. UHCC 0171]